VVLPEEVISKSRVRSFARVMMKVVRHRSLVAYAMVNALKSWAHFGQCREMSTSTKTGHSSF
jgi:hypothetical protein